MFPKGIGDLSGVFKQAMSLKDNMDKLKEELEQERVCASAGAGMVEIEMTGKQEVIGVKIDPELVTTGDTEMIETLVKAAVNEANKKVQELVKERMTALTGGIDIPGITS